jgi:glyoxylase-like metal-dependent hydrolase (beta-lactamase superfamily II)
MEPSSPGQKQALDQGELPPLDQVRDDVWALAQPMPGGHPAYSYAYLLRASDGTAHVIDPGWNSDGNWDRLTGALGIVAPGGAVMSITGTHLHSDHVGLAARLRAASGADIAMHHVERRTLRSHDGREPDTQGARAKLVDWGVPEERRRELAQRLDRSPADLAFAVDHGLTDGDVLPIPGFTLTVMATPGHTAGHICLRDDDRNLLLTGDHVLPNVVAGLGLGGTATSNALADYLASIDRVSAFPDHEALPGHGYRFRGLPGRAAACAEHHLDRTREVAAVLARAGARQPTVWEIAGQLTWTAGWDGLHGFQLLSALAQTEMHREYVRTAGAPG